MKKNCFLISLSFLSLILSGCGTTPRQVVDSSAKSVFLSCKKKVEVVKNSISELTMDEHGDFSSDRQLTNKRQTRGSRYEELTKDKYLSLQNFGLYILNDLYHAITYGYDSESVELSTLIYDEVQNELNGPLREHLKKNNLSSQFYMQIEKVENAYTFQVDWLGLDNTRGNIYVGGKVELSGEEATKFTVTSFTQDNSCYVFVAHYDFIENNFYMFNTSHEGSDSSLNGVTLEMIEKLNNNQFTSSDLKEINYSSVSLASGKITKNVKEVNYKGLARWRTDTESSNEEFDSLFDTLRQEISNAKIRTSSDQLDYSNSRRVHFMDNALQYGLDTTKLYVNNNGVAYFSFLEADDFIKMCDNVPTDFEEIFKKAKNKLLSKVGQDKSIDYEDEEIMISQNPVQERYSTLNTYLINDFNYKIVDKIEDYTIEFYVKGESLYGVHLSNSDYVPNDDPNYEEQIKIFTGLGSAATAELETQVIEKFNEKYKGKYKVVQQSSGSSNNLVNTIVAMSSSGHIDNLPELIMLNSSSLTRVVYNESARKFLYNFDSFINDEVIGINDDELSMYDQEMFQDGTSYNVDGRWSLPFNSNDSFLVYDPTYFEGDDKQFDVPVTFEDLIEVSKAIKATKDEGFTPIALSNDSQFLVDLMLQNDIPFIGKDFSYGFKEEENKDKIIALFEELKGYITSGLISLYGATFEYSYGLLREGRCAFAIMSGTEVNYLRDSNFKVSVVPFANNNQVYSRNNISSFALLKTGKPFATRGAWLFIKEMLSNFSINYSINSFKNPLMKYDLNNISATGLRRDVAAISTEIRDKYVSIPKTVDLNQIYEGPLPNALRSLYNQEPAQAYERLLMY